MTANLPSTGSNLRLLQNSSKFRTDHWIPVGLVSRLGHGLDHSQLGKGSAGVQYSGPDQWETEISSEASVVGQVLHKNSHKLVVLVVTEQAESTTLTGQVAPGCNYSSI